MQWQTLQNMDCQHLFLLKTLVKGIGLQSIESGVVWINTWLLRDLRIPFGGMKYSGIGREGGFKSLEFFTEPKKYLYKI